MHHSMCACARHDCVYVYLVANGRQVSWTEKCKITEKPCVKVNVNCYKLFYQLQYYIILNFSPGQQIPTLAAALKLLLPTASDWLILGTLLEIPDNNLRSIENELNRDNARLREVLCQWLKQIKPMPTWSRLAEAVSQVNDKVARDIEKRSKGFTL